jgi:hypothetical protein
MATRPRSCRLLGLVVALVAGQAAWGGCPGPPDAAKEERTLPPEAGGEVGLGPLRLRTQAPGQGLRLGLIPRCPDTLPRGHRSVAFYATWANVWANQPGRFLLDYEQLNVQVEATIGITDRWNLEVGFEGTSAFGGYMDGFIQGFHDLFGVRQSGRDEYPKGGYAIRIEPTATQPGLDAAEGRGDLDAFGRVTLIRQISKGGRGRPALAATLTVQADLQHGLFFGGSGWDVGAQLIGAKRLGDFHVYVSGGWIRYGRSFFEEVRLRRTTLSGMGAVEWRYRPDASLVVQLLLSEGIADDYHVFSDVAHEITLGWKRRLKDGWLLEVGLIENIIEFDNSPDFGVHLGLTRRMGPVRRP